MKRAEIEDLIREAYKEKYVSENAEIQNREASKEEYDWENVEIRDVVPCMGGWIGVVSGKQDHEEICFVKPESETGKDLLPKERVEIFDTTRELARFLQKRPQPLLVESLVARPVISGSVFLLLLIGLFALAVFHVQIEPTLMSTLTSVVGVAAGYFFGTAKG